LHRGLIASTGPNRSMKSDAVTFIFQLFGRCIG
jgi:hypothetical protein